MWKFIDSYGIASVSTWLLWPKALYLLLEFCTSYSHIILPRLSKASHEEQVKAYGSVKPFLPVACFLGSVFWTALADVTQEYFVILATCISIYPLACFALQMCKGWLDSADQSIANLLLTIGLLLLQVFASGLLPILDAQTMTLLSQQATSSSCKDLFGIQRFWGYLGDVVVLLLALFGWGRSFNASLSIFLMSILLFIGSAMALHRTSRYNSDDASSGILVSQQQEKQHTKDNPTTIDEASPSSPFCKLITDSRFLALLILTFVSAIGKAVLETRLSCARNVMVRNSKDRIMFSMVREAVELVAKAGTFLISVPLIRFCGPTNLLILGISVGMLQTAWYGFVSSGGGILFSDPYAEISQAISTTLILVSGTRIAHDVAPKGTKAIAQGIFTGIHYHLSDLFAALFQNMFIGDAVERLKWAEHVDGENVHLLKTLFKSSALASLVSVALYGLFIFMN